MITVAAADGSAVEPHNWRSEIYTLIQANAHTHTHTHTPAYRARPHLPQLGPLRVSTNTNKESKRIRESERKRAGLFIIVVATKVAEKCITN